MFGAKFTDIGDMTAAEGGGGGPFCFVGQELKRSSLDLPPPLLQGKEEEEVKEEGFQVYTRILGSAPSATVH